MRHYCASRDDRIVPDRHTFCDNNPCTDPDFPADMDGRRIEDVRPVRIDVVV